MAAPTFVGVATDAGGYVSTGATTATNSISVQAGDLLIAIGGTALQSSAQISSVATSGVTYTLLDQVTNATFPGVKVYYGTAPSTTSVTCTFTISASGTKFGGSLYVFRNANINHTGSAADNTASYSCDVVTTTTGSAIVWFAGDSAAIDGASRTALTATAGAYTESTYVRSSPGWTVYSGYHANSGAAATKTVGLSAPAGQNVGIVAAEVVDVPVTFFGSKMQQGVG